MIANSLVVNGAARFLNKIYANDLQVSGTTSFTNLSVTGNASINGTINIGSSNNANTIINLNGKRAIAGVSGSDYLWLRINDTKAFSNGVYFGSSVIRTDGQLQIGGSGSKLAVTTTDDQSGISGATNGHALFGVPIEMNGTANYWDTTGKLVTSNLDVNSARITNLQVTDTLRSFKWDIDHVANLGGNFLVTPTYNATENSATFAVNSISGTTITAIINDSTAISGSTLGGVTWAKDSKIKITGKIGGVVLPVCEGKLTNQLNNSSGAMNIQFTYPNQSSNGLSVKTYGASEVSGLTVMLLTVGATNPIGIYMTARDSNNYSHISLYGGTDTKPVVRIGNLQGLDPIGGVDPDNNDVAIKWGIYTYNGFFKGVIAAERGVIGSNTTVTNNWQIGNRSIWYGNSTPGASNTALVISTGTSSTNSIAGSGTSSKTWMIAAGTGFGVTNTGVMYATGAHVSGEITAESGTIGGASISNGVLQIKEANISGTISGSKITAGTISVGSLDSSTQTKINNGNTAKEEVDALREDFDAYSNPIASKQYTNVIAAVNNDDTKCTFYFGTITPTNYNVPWKIKYRIQAKINNINDGYEASDVMFSGTKNIIRAYQTYNSIVNTDRRPYYYHILYTCTQTGITNNYGHLFGVNLRYSYNAATTDNSRNITVEVFETQNCTVVLKDTPFLYTSAPGTGSTNYQSRNSYDATTQGFTESGDRNETNHILNNFAGKTGANGVWAGGLFMEDAFGTFQSICTASDGTATSGNRTTATTKKANINGFKVNGTLYYNGSSYNANVNMTSNNVYGSIGAIDSRYSLNTMTGTTAANTTGLTVYKPFYLVGSINNSDGLFYFDSTWWTQTPNTTGKIYILAGSVYDITGSGSAYYYRINLYEQNTWFIYDGSALVPYIKYASDEAAKTATTYITDIDSKKGITIKPSDSSGNDYLQMNSSAISFYRNNVQTTKMEDSAIRVGKLGTNLRNVYITDSAVQIRNNTDVLAEYGSAIKLYQPGSPTTAVVTIDSNGGSFTGSVTATRGTIGGWTANSSYGLYTNSKTSATSTNTGILIQKDGGIYAGAYNSTNGSCPFQVTNAGVLTAISGIIGGWTIGATSLYNNKSSFNNSNEGIYIGTDYIAGGAGEEWWLKKDGSAKIGALTLSAAGVLAVPAANITGTLSADRIAAGSLELGKLTTTAQTTISDAAKTATNYLTYSSSSGLTIGYSGSNSKSVINTNGMEIFNGSNKSAAFFGLNNNVAISRVGLTNEGNVVMANGGIDLRYGNTNIAHIGYDTVIDQEGNTKQGEYFSFGENGRKQNEPIGLRSFTHGYNNIASKYNTFASGSSNIASNQYAHAEGYKVTASGLYSHAQGQETTASGTASHAEGCYTTASGANGSHAEGYYTTASGTASHAGGNGAIASGSCSFSYGFYPKAQGENSTAFGSSTIANGKNQFVVGSKNIEDTNNEYAFIVGIGSSSNFAQNGISEDRENGLTVDWEGTVTARQGFAVPHASWISSSKRWISGRELAAFRNTLSSFVNDTYYNPILSVKSHNGTWDIGTYYDEASSNTTNNSLYFTYITDQNYNSATNTISAQIEFRDSDNSIRANNFVGALATFSDTVVLSKTTDASANGDYGPALVVGGTRTQAHMEIDANEIQAKSGATGGAHFYLNYEGGNIYLGNSTVINATSKDIELTSGSFLVKTKNKGIYLTDKNNNLYGALYDNNNNLCIGHTAGANYHHAGGTYISTGWNGTDGNETIYVSVPHSNSTSGGNTLNTYGVWHKGNLAVKDISSEVTLTKSTNCNSVTLNKAYRFGALVYINFTVVPNSGLSAGASVDITYNGPNPWRGSDSRIGYGVYGNNCYACWWNSATVIRCRLLTSSAWANSQTVIFTGWYFAAGA